MTTEDLTRQLVNWLKKTDPCKIILFGSHAYGEPGPESDIDLLVVTEDDFLPNSFAEKNAIFLRVSNSITEIEKRIPIDLIVHTKAMHRKFIEMRACFSEKLLLMEKFCMKKITEDWLKAAKDDLDVIENLTGGRAMQVRILSRIYRMLLLLRCANV